MQLSLLTKEEEMDLTRYAKILDTHASSEDYILSSRKGRKSRRLEMDEVSREKDSLQNRFGIGWRWSPGRWNLKVEGMSDNPGDLYGDDLEYWRIFPLRSDRKDILDYLAEEALPEIFAGRKFIVVDTVIPTHGDCSWDCA